LRRRKRKQQEQACRCVAPDTTRSQPVAQLPFNELKELQQLLVRAGYNIGKVDGVLGQQSCIAVKAMQVK
jgi:hypothetical protein